ncbi:hypothetical protein D9758_005934 [Tetrapyrgos nigripes]|uniref:TM7S3/TM198-like domain-containing protein n=1 Tax=Tetrapyrgos nigripes TaxID=182062 RepID=A0A8H5G363_9AGAR|nr:hypothetical protein D9758_005934 [Tetrapyrgos nigripes]
MTTAAAIVWLLVCQLLFGHASASALSFPRSLSTGIVTPFVLAPRDIEIRPLPDGTSQVVDTSKNRIIPQGLATDGSGSGFQGPAIIWIIYLLALGVPLAIAGIRGWRFTTGVALALAAAVCAWAAIINSVNEVGVSDFVLILVILAFSFLGFIMGIFEFARVGATGILGVVGGLAFGMRVVLLKDGLLFSAKSLYFLNWIIAGFFGAAGGLTIIWWQRLGLLFACASSGTFLTVLGVDLILYEQSGLSRGLRFLFDRNSSHIEDILGNGYHPTLITVIMLAVSMGVVPLLALLQHRIFPQPFRRKTVESDEELAIDDPTTQLRMFSPASRPATFFLSKMSRFSL